MIQDEGSTIYMAHATTQSTQTSRVPLAMFGAGKMGGILIEALLKRG
jgi:hypothetical protein